MGLSWNVQHIPVAGLLYSNRTGRANPPAVIQPVWAGPLVVSGRQCANCENEPRAGACLEKPQIKRVKSGTWPGWLVRVGRGFSNLAAGNNSSTISVSGSTVKRARLDGSVSAPGPNLKYSLEQTPGGCLILPERQANNQVRFLKG